MVDRSTPFLQSGRGMSADYKSVFRLAISRTVWRNRQKSRKIAKFGLNMIPCNFFGGGSPQILKPVLGTSFQGLLPGKFWTTALALRGWEKISPPPQFFFLGGGRGPQGVHKLDIMTHYHS